MVQQLVNVDIGGQVAWVRLNHPPANLLTSAMLKELDRAFGALEGDTRVRVVVLTGTGTVFCAGADINELTTVNTALAGSEFAGRGQALLNRIERYDKPVIAAINGTCVGGGLELVLACHIRVAAAGAVLGLPEVKLGLIPGFGGTQRLPRIVGPSKAAELILTGATIAAQDAVALGLVNRVVLPAELLREAEALAGDIKARGRLAIQCALRAIRSGLDSPLAVGLAREAELFGELCESPDKKEGTRAFLEKREPKFEG
ncbi:enoyl-CoA hydratase-related protein [Candidatus Nitrospira bockiana]